MAETVTVKKNRIHPVIVLLFGILGICLFFISNEVTRRYQYALVFDELSFGGKAWRFVLCAVLYFACITLVSLAFGEGCKWLYDHERFVAIRKSSMENATAMKFYQDFKKKVGRIALINHLILVAILSVLVMVFVVKGGSKTEFSLIIWGICFLSVLNPVSRNLRKKEEAKRSRILTEDCDPALSFDIFELFRMEVEARIIRNNQRLQQAIACFYLLDYTEMDRKLSQLEGKLMPMQDGQVLLLRGLAALDMGQPERFRECSEALHRMETAPRTLAVTQKYYQEIRRDWQGRIDLAGPEPAKALPYVQEELQKGKFPLFWMDFTFQLAWIELSLGQKDRARENLMLVAERAGTMAIREKAKKMLENE